MDNDGLVFVDYKKAFDLVDHYILLSKLEAYGVTSKELLPFEEYLKGRRKFQTRLSKLHVTVVRLRKSLHEAT